MTAPKTPSGLKSAGRRLWSAVSDDFDLDVHEQLLLLQACRCVDRLDRLEVEANAGNVTVTNFKGDQVANPAMVEARQQSIVLARLLASLRMPAGEASAVGGIGGSDGPRPPQRRGGARAPYRLRGVS